jgi:molybdopterin molybdotransferase
MLLPYEDAIERALRGVSRLATERVWLDSAADRVLAEDVVANTPMPPFSYSAMDGYAVRVSFFRGEGPWTLPLRGEARAGRPGPPLQPGTASRIFTGAPIPAGCNAVVAQEQTVRNGPEVTFRVRPQEWENIRPEGADMARGTLALPQGERLAPGKLGLLAALDRCHVIVARQPAVAIVSTGDELRPPGAPGTPSSVPESNSPVIAAIVRRAGATSRTLPLLADDAERTEAEIRRALRGTDLLVTIGGASVGEHDLVRPAMEAAGVTIDFWGVAIKPAKPTAVGSAPGCKVLCLPGNPASAILAFLLFGVPMLRAMQGERVRRPSAVPMRVIGAHVRRPGRQEYLRARLELHDGEMCVALPPSQSSGAVTSFAYADALVVLGPDRARISNGDRLPVLRLSDIWS